MHSQSKSATRVVESRRVRILLAAMSVVALSSTPANAFNLIGAPFSARDLRIAARSDGDRKAERADDRDDDDDDDDDKDEQKDARQDAKKDARGDDRKDAAKDGGSDNLKDERKVDQPSGWNSDRKDEGKVDQPGGWNNDRKGERKVDRVDGSKVEEKREPARDSWDRGGSEKSKRSGGDPFDAGDTALSAGKYLEAFTLYREEAHKLSQSGKADAGTLALAYERVGNAARLAGRYSDAESMLKQAAGHCGVDRALAKVKVRVLFELADLLSFEGIPDDGLVSIDQAFRAAAAGERSANLDAELHLLNARLLTEQGKLAEAEKEFQTTQGILDRMGEPSTSDLPPSLPLSKSKEQLAGKLAANRAAHARLSGNTASASQLEADAATKLNHAYGSQGPADAEDHRYLPEVLKLRSQIMSLPADQARARYEGAVAILPANAGYAKAALLLEYGKYQLDALDFKGAEATFKAAGDLLQTVAPARSNIACAAQVGLGESYLNSLKINSAVKIGQVAYSKLERTNGLNSKAFADSAAIVGRAYVAMGQFGPGQVNLHKAIRIYDKTIGKGTYERARASESLAVVNLRNRQYQVAVDLATSSLQTEEKLFGANSPMLVLNLTTMGNANAHLKKYGDADRQLARAQSILLKAGKSDTPSHADVVAGIGINAALQKKWKPAETNFKKAIEIYTKTQGPRSAGTLAMVQLLKTMKEMRDGGQLMIQNALMQGNFTPKRPDQQQ
jgi:hypothetical protein